MGLPSFVRKMRQLHLYAVYPSFKFSYHGIGQVTEEAEFYLAIQTTLIVFDREHFQYFNIENFPGQKAPKTP